MPATSEIATPPPTLTPIQKKFILHWGEMGARWGVNRTVAQVHALLYLSAEPLDAEAICDALQVARSNVSTSLKELQGWGIVHVVPVLGERRDHFGTTTDVWAMFQVILDERKRRELDPTLELLRQCVEEADASASESDHTRRRLRELHGMLETITNWYAQVRALPQGAVIKFVKTGTKVFKTLGLTR
ncbi:MAG: MarR family transcriptional regulator [Planctomycetota bacterium]